MSFRRAILFALITAAVLPVIAVGGLSYRANREELLRTVGRSQAQAAAELARWCEGFVIDRAQALQLSAGYIPFASLSGPELEAVVRIPLRQIPDLTMLTVVDATGTPVADTVHRAGVDGVDGARRGPDPRDLDAFARSLSIESARASDIAIGLPYPSPSSGIPRVALAVREREADRFVVAELSLADADARLRELASGGSAFLVDGAGRPFTSSAGEVSEDERGLFAAGRGAAGGATRTVRAHGGAAMLASYAPVPLLGWGVVLEQPTSTAFRAADRIGRYMLFWAFAALGIALLLGSFLARPLARPVAQLSEAAGALTRGRYDVRVDETGFEELGRLGTAFNHMAREVQRRDEEIRCWNAELQRRVQERTTELRDAQDQIARARRLAAMGSLGAGVAHGLNNPLTSLLGLVALARREVTGSAAGELLDSAMAEGRRIVRIVEDLKRLTERERNEAGRAFALAQPVRAAVEAQRRRLDERHIALATDLDGDVPLVQGHPMQVQDLVTHLLDNAVEAMPDGGQIEVRLSAVNGDAVRLHVADDGRGIAPGIRERIFDPFFTTKSTPGAGLGLSICHGIVENLHGRIAVESAPGGGTRFDIVFPAAAPAAHLA
jgi:signal transduction histidine kinase